MTQEEITVDREYLWALEVLALDNIDTEDQPVGDRYDALRVVREANLKQPRER